MFSTPFDQFYPRLTKYKIVLGRKNSLHTFTHKKINSQAWFAKRNNYSLQNMNRLKSLLDFAQPGPE